VKLCIHVDYIEIERYIIEKFRKYKIEELRKYIGAEKQF